MDMYSYKCICMCKRICIRILAIDLQGSIKGPNEGAKEPQFADAPVRRGSMDSQLWFWVYTSYLGTCTSTATNMTIVTTAFPQEGDVSETHNIPYGSKYVNHACFGASSMQIGPILAYFEPQG